MAYRHAFTAPEDGRTASSIAHRNVIKSELSFPDDPTHGFNGNRTRVWSLRGTRPSR